MARTRGRTLFFLGTTLGCLSSLGAAQGSYVSLGGLGYGSSAEDTTGDGSITAGSRSGVSGSSAAIWDSAGTSTEIPCLPGGSECFAVAVSADGEVVAGAGYVAPIYTVFRWTASQGTVDLGPFPGNASATAWGMSADGSVIVGSFGFTSQTREAFAWELGQGLTVIDGLPGATSTEALCVSEDGETVCGASGVGFSDRRAFRWTKAGGSVDLGLLPGGAWSLARDTNANGTVVAGTGESAGVQRAFRWTSGAGMVELDAPGWVWTSALGVDATGDVVVGEGKFQGVIQAFVWKPATGTVPLTEVLVNTGGPALEPELLRVARGVSADGQTIVGRGPTFVGDMYESGWIVQLNEVGQKYCGPAVVNSTQLAASLAAEGSLLVGDNRVVLRARLLPPNELGYFLNGPRQGTSFPAGSVGRLCLAGPIGRFTGPGEVRSSGPEGSFALQLDLLAFPRPTGFIAVAPGETWNFQSWFRDHDPTPTSNFTDAVSVTFL